MSKSMWWSLVVAVFVVLLQILVCNPIALWGIATPFAIVYLFVKTPTGIRPHILMSVAFFIGLLIDIFANTLGVYALASVTLAFLHDPLLAHIQYRDRGEESFVPSFETLGTGGYILFTTLFALVFSAVAFCAESFSFFSKGVLLARIAGSTVLTVVVLLIVDLLMERKR